MEKVHYLIIKEFLLLVNEYITSTNRPRIMEKVHYLTVEGFLLLVNKYHVYRLDTFKEKKNINIHFLLVKEITDYHKNLTLTNLFLVVNQLSIHIM